MLSHASLHAHDCQAAIAGEAELQSGVAGRLLKVLVHRRPLAAQLAQLDSWRQLTGAPPPRQEAEKPG